MSNFEFEYAPILIGGTRRYIIELPEDSSPTRFWTITAPMLSWAGEVIGTSPGRAQALIRDTTGVHKVEGFVTSPLLPGMPCVVMEHLNVDGQMEYMIGRIDIMDGQRNFVNYGVPTGKHIRIDIYTGESRIING